MKHVLIALCGMSPAVITETLYCLRRDVPDEVVVITTSRGRKCLIDELLRSGVWANMLSVLNIRDAGVLKENHHHIRLIPHSENGSAEDISDDRTNAAMADFILGVLRQFTENPDTRITFSLAGGRKTMSAVGALSMALLGRARDELCHVLVSPPFDSPLLSPKFYFPEQGKTHFMPDGSSFASAEAEVLLCRIPYVQQRYIFDDRLKRMPGDYVDTVRMVNARVAAMHSQAPLELLPEACSCRIGEHTIPLSGFEFVALWLLARRRIQGEKDFHGTPEFRKEFLKFAKMIKKETMPEMMAVRETLQNKSDDDMRKPVSSVRQKLCRALGSEGAKPYFLSSKKGKYGMTLPPDKIILPDI